MKTLSKRSVPYLFAISVISVFASIAAVSDADAQALSVGPVNIQLAPGQMTAALTVVNLAESATSFQIRAYSWSEQDGKDQLVPSDALVASPPLGSIDGKGKQLIRLVLREKPTVKEATYRIWLDQIPSPAAATSVRIALRFSIPVFAQPDTRSAPDVQWRIVREHGDIFLVGNNIGTRHETVRNLVLTEARGGMLETDGNVSPHILAGAERRWRISSAERLPAAGSQVQLTADTDGGSINQSIAFASDNP